MPYAETALGRLFVQVAGNGPTLTFWHCLFGDGGLWHPQTRQLMSSARVVVVDGPGHGRSSPRVEAFTLEQCADAWVQALDRVGIHEPAVFVGLSWGAMVAMRVALRHPGRVRSLALFGAIATAPRPSDRLRFAALATLLGTGAATALLPRLVPTLVSPTCSDLSRAQVTRMLARGAAVDRRSLYRSARAVLVDRSGILPELTRVTAPSLVCVGAEDRITPPSCARRVARALPQSELHVVEHAAHLLPIEAPARVTALLAKLALGEAIQRVAELAAP